MRPLSLPVYHHPHRECHPLLSIQIFLLVVSHLIILLTVPRSYHLVSPPRAACSHRSAIFAPSEDDSLRSSLADDYSAIDQAQHSSLRRTIEDDDSSVDSHLINTARKPAAHIDDSRHLTSSAKSDSNEHIDNAQDAPFLHPAPCDDVTHVEQLLDPLSTGYDIPVAFPTVSLESLLQVPPYAATQNCSTSPANEYHMCKLLKLCDSIRAPKHFFQKVLEWGQFASNDGFQWNSPHPTRKSFTKTLQDKFCLPPPSVVHVPIERLPGTPYEDRSIELPLFDIRMQLHRVFHSHVVTDVNNLVLKDPDRPFLPYDQPSRRVLQWQDGYLYQSMLRRLWQPGRLVLGAIIYADKTHTDILGRFVLEPLVLSLSIFSMDAMYMHEHKVVLAYLISLDMKSSAQNSLENDRDELGGLNVRNYHRQLHAALAGLRQIMSDGGIVMSVRLGKEVKVVRVVIELLAILGDGKSQDVMCARIHRPILEQNDRLHWSCNCEAVKMDDPDVCCKFNLVKEFREHVNVALCKAKDPGLAQRQALSALREYSLYPSDLAFFHTKNACELHGPYCMSTVCLMHTADEGIGKAMLEQTFSFLGGRGRAAVDHLLRVLVKTNRQTEYLFGLYPKTDFTRGVSNLSCLKAYEWQGLVFLMAVLFRSGVGRHRLSGVLEKARDDLYAAADNSDPALFTDFRQYDDLGHKSIDNLAQMFEGYATFRAWTKRRDGFWNASNLEHSVDGEVAARLAISALLKMILGYCPRVKRYRATLNENSPSPPNCAHEEGVDDDVSSSSSSSSLFHPSNPRNVWKRKRSGSHRLLHSSSVRTGKCRDDDSSHAKPTGGRHVPRKVWKLKRLGNGWSRQKFHSHLHIPELITKFGSPELMDTSSEEFCHKPIAKDPASRVQKRHRSFTTQCAASHHDGQLIDLGICTSSRYQSEPSFSTQPSLPARNKECLETKVATTSVSVVITFQGISRNDASTEPASWGLSTVEPRTRSHHPFVMHPAVLRFLRREMFSDNPHAPKCTGLHCATEIKLKGIGQLRSHPNFQGDGPWKDWVVTSREFVNSRSGRRQRQDVPVAIHTFIIAKMVKHPEEDEACEERMDDILAVVCLCNRQTKTDTDGYESQLLQHYLKSYLQNSNPHFALIPISAIKHCVLVFEDHPVLEEFHSDWKARMQRSITNKTDDDFPPVTWYENIQPMHYQWKESSADRENRDSDCIEKDWVYLVRLYSEWADEFCPIPPEE